MAHCCRPRWYRDSGSKEHGDISWPNLVLAAIPAAAIKRPARTWVAILSGACLGMVLEVAQMRIPVGVFEWRDVRANSTGFIVGILAALPFRLGVAVALLPGLARPSRLALRE